MYEKVGFDVIRPNLTSGNGTNIGTPTQKKGFGFIHDGAVSLTEFLAAPVFTSTTQQERDVFAFMLAFPTESPPAIGRQVTVTSANKNDAAVTGADRDADRAGRSGRVRPDRQGCRGRRRERVGLRSDDERLRAGLDRRVARQRRGAPRRARRQRRRHLYRRPAGAGVRAGIDRDRDTFLDRTEISLGTDPADPHSNPWRWAP